MGLMLAVGLCCWRVSAWLREMENVRCLPTLRLARAPSFSISTNSLSTHNFEWSHTIHPDPDDIASNKTPSLCLSCITSDFEGTREARKPIFNMT